MKKFSKVLAKQKDLCGSTFISFTSLEAKKKKKKKIYRLTYSCPLTQSKLQITVIEA